MRLNINYKKKQLQETQTHEDKTFLNNQQVTEEIKKFYKQMIMKTGQLRTYGMQQEQF